MSFFRGYFLWMWGYVVGKSGERHRNRQYWYPPQLPNEYYKNAQMNYRYNR